MPHQTPPDFLALANRWGNLPLLWWQMYWAALETIGYRVPMMAAAGLQPNARQRRENNRMVTEKMSAALETAGVLWAPPPLKLTQPLWQLWTTGWQTNIEGLSELQRAMFSGTWPLALGTHAVQTLEQSLRPWHRGATGNARRLRRRRR